MHLHFIGPLRLRLGCSVKVEVRFSISICCESACHCTKFINLIFLNHVYLHSFCSFRPITSGDENYHADGEGNIQLSFLNLFSTKNL